jgi:hypothetical protein
MFTPGREHLITKQLDIKNSTRIIIYKKWNPFDNSILDCVESSVSITTKSVLFLLIGFDCVPFAFNLAVIVHERIG